MDIGSQGSMLEMPVFIGSQSIISDLFSIKNAAAATASSVADQCAEESGACCKMQSRPAALASYMRWSASMSSLSRSSGARR